jgi:hypothetical protein
MNPDAADVQERSERFREQARTFGLVFRCDSCVHFLPPGRACSLGYPAHLLEGDPEACFTSEGAWRFCKYFELA